MKTDVIHVDSEGNGFKKSLAQADVVAQYKDLSHKDALHIRLLTEEMMGMLRSITGKKEADFWIDDDEESDNFRLHLLTETPMNMEKRDKLLSVSTSGENSAVKGVMGKIKDLFTRSYEPLDDSGARYYAAGWMYDDAAVSGGVADIALQMWSFNKYRETISPEGENGQEWDELERSVIANLADEVEIYIRKKQVEMIVYKKCNSSEKEG